MTESIFDAYSRYYDILYADKDYAAESKYVDGLLRRHGVTGSEVLEFGSGTGGHGRVLSELGYRVFGIERSAEMVAVSEQSAGFQCQVGDISAVRLGRYFDAVISLFHVVSYQISNKSVQAVFERAADHLLTGGVFVFDVWYSPAVCGQRPSVRVKQLESNRVNITRIAEPTIYPNENRVDVRYRIFAEELASGRVESLIETHPMRHFSLPELDLFAQMTGFVRVGVEEFLTGREPSDHTWGVCCIFQRC